MKSNIHITINDYILENSRYIIDEYFFSTDKYDYKISILKNDSEPNYPYFGFKAKSKGSRDFHYDQSIITNDNFYLVMKNVLNYLNNYKNNNIDGFIFSTYSNKKGIQRMNIYKKYLKRDGWKIADTEYPTYFKISKVVNINENHNQNYNHKFSNTDVKVGDYYNEADIYGYVQRIHHTYDDFIDGDLGERIEEFEKYIVKEVDISDIEIDEFIIDEDLVDEYKEKFKISKKYPVIILNDELRIIDGTHRVNALHELGYNKVIAFVGVDG